MINFLCSAACFSLLGPTKASFKYFLYQEVGSEIRTETAVAQSGHLITSLAPFP